MIEETQIGVHQYTRLIDRGGATGGMWGTTYPPLLRYIPHRGYNAIYVVHLRVRGTIGYS